MGAATVPSGPLQEAAVQLGRAIARAHAIGATEVLAPVREAILHLLEAAREQADLKVLLAREKVCVDRVAEQNSKLFARLAAAHADREQLVRDLAPALATVAEIFNRAVAMRDALTPSSTPYVPAPTTTESSDLDGYRASPVEAHTGD